MSNRMRTRASRTPSSPAPAVPRRSAPQAAAPPGHRVALARSLQRRAGNRATRALLAGDHDAARRGTAAREVMALGARSGEVIQGVRRSPGEAPLRRKLGALHPIQTNDVRGVQRLSQEKLVFRLTGRRGTSVIIKIEGANEEQGAYSAREREVYEMARAVLKKTPKASQLTDNDLAAIDAIADDMGDVAQLKDAIHNLPGSKLFLKVETVNVGINLQELWQGGPGNQTNDQTRRLTKILFSKSTMNALGRMAALDLLVGNSDRFGTDRRVNPENVDFTRGGSVLPLDNLDPYSRIQPDDWPAAQYLETGPGISTYMVDVTEYLFSLAGLDRDDDHFERSAMAFGGGMVKALAIMRGQLGRLAQQAQQDGPRGEIAAELARRIALTFAG